MMSIDYNENLCVRCGACATEAEDGGIILQHGKIIIDESRNEDWANIAAICPVGALHANKRRR